MFYSRAWFPTQFTYRYFQSIITVCGAKGTATSRNVLCKVQQHCDTGVGGAAHAAASWFEPIGGAGGLQYILYVL